MKNFINKKLVYTLGSFLLSLILFISLIFIYEGNKKNTYEIEVNQEVLIKEVEINGGVWGLETIANKYGLVYDSNRDCVIISKNAKFQISKIYNFNIVFETSPALDNIIIKTNNKKEVISLYTNDINRYTHIMNNPSDISIIKSYFINDLKISHIAISLIGMGIFYIMLFSLFKIIIKMKENKINFKDILFYYIIWAITLLVVTFPLVEFLNILYSYILAILLILLIMYIRKSKIKIENIFIMIVIPTAISISLLIPVGHVPDENSHYYKSYLLASKIIGKDINPENDYCLNVNKTVDNVLSEFNYAVHSPGYKLTAKAYFKNIIIRDKKEYLDNKVCYNNVQRLPFVAYTFTIISSIISFIFSLPVYISYTFAELINLFTYIAILYYCIKTIPKFKKSLLIASTLPIAIQQAGAINQDCIHNALFFLLFTQIIRAIYSKGLIKNSEKVKIIIISILLSFCKLGYFPIIFLCLLIPKERFATEKNEYINKAIIILPMILLFILLYITTWHTSINNIGNPNNYSIYNLFSNPKDFILLYINTFRKRWFYLYVQGLIDSFGYSTKLNSTMSAYLIIMCYTLLLFVNNKNKNTVKYNIVSILIFLFTSIIIFTSMLGGTGLGSEHVMGLQARYFVSVELFILSIVDIPLMKLNINNENIFYGVILILINLATIITIIEGFYV